MQNSERISDNISQFSALNVKDSHFHVNLTEKDGINRIFEYISVFRAANSDEVQVSFKFKDEKFV